jgi:hypothetical protein
MKQEQRRLLEMAGILRRNTPDRLLTEGEDEGGDDPFEDDSGDDGGDDLFGDGGDDGEEGDEGGDSGEDSAEAEETNRIPPQDLKPEDIKKFGSPRFLDVETKVSNMFNQSYVSASVGAQELESYPGNAIEESEPTPAKENDPKEKEEEEEKNESFYRYGDKRNKWLINEAIRLLNEAEDEGAAADEFDMESFCNQLANYMDTIHNTEDIEAGIFNMGRQMILNNFGQDTETEFINMLASVSGDKYAFLQTGFEGGDDIPVAVGATNDAGA